MSAGIERRKDLVESLLRICDGKGQTMKTIVSYFWREGLTPKKAESLIKEGLKFGYLRKKGDKFITYKG